MSVATGQPGLTRDDLMHLSADGDSYAFLRAVLPRLCEAPADAELRLQVVRHYAMLGLVGPALEILEALPDEVRALPDVAQAIAQFESVPSGQVPWSRIRPQFEANLAVLGERLPALRALPQVWADYESRLELFQCRDGNFQISWINNSGDRQWLPQLLDHKGQADQTEIPRDKNELLPHPYVFEGLHYGWLFERVVKETAKTFLYYRPAVYVLEPNTAALAALLHFHDWAELLADPRILIFTGPECGEQFREALVADDQLPLPMHCLRMAQWGGPAIESAVSFVQAAQDARVTVLDDLQAKVTAMYDDCDAAFWARRFAGASEQDPLRIMFVVSRHTTYLKYAMRDLARAFEARGMKTYTLIENADHAKVSAVTYQRAILDFKPELFFLIDHFRAEYRGAIPANVPFVGWIQDQLPNLYSREAGASLGPLDFFIAPHLTEFIERYGYPAENGMVWTMATDDRVYSAERMSEAELSPYRCDFSFVSNQSKVPWLFHEERREAFKEDPAAMRLVDQLFGALLQDMYEQPRTMCSDLGVLHARVLQQSGLKCATREAEDALLNFYLWPIAELLFRQRTLEWVADYCDRQGLTLRLYGNGWEEHPRFSKYACGFAGNGQELRAIYQASTINLQITTHGAVHQRLLDGLAAGGFFLIRFSPHDVVHEVAERILAEVDRTGIALDTQHAEAEAPELYEAYCALVAVYGKQRRNGTFYLSSAAIERFRELAQSGYRRVAGAVFERYGDVEFGLPHEFAQRADRFLADETTRAAIVSSMRAAVMEHFTYGAAVDAVVAFVRRRLGETARGGAG
ncbi:MAG: hypothetical protein JXA69_09230 [Phycisphaerae bacterium]|nr:hypothetical protein [Phycisphaerae bacterium]